MKEEEWLESADWHTLWFFAHARDYLTPRKSRLLAVAVCWELRNVVADYRTLRMLGFAEEWADASTNFGDEWSERRAKWQEETTIVAHGLPDPLTRQAAFAFAELADEQAGRAIEAVASFYGCPAMNAGVRPSRCSQVAKQIREIVGNPFHPVVIEPGWLTSDVRTLAEGIYQERAFDRMPILADALQDAGCNNDDILNHCRQPGEHVRGCWVVDLLTGRK